MGNSYTELKAPSVLPKIGNSATTLPFQLGQPKIGNSATTLPFQLGQPKIGNSATTLPFQLGQPKIGNSATTLPFQLGQPKGGNEDRERVPFPSGGSGRIGMAPRFQVDLDESVPPLAAIVEEGAPGPFRDAALDLLARGLAVVPCRSADGKVPLVEWGKWTKRPGRAFIEKMMRRYPAANIG